MQDAEAKRDPNRPWLYDRPANISEPLYYEPDVDLWSSNTNYESLLRVNVSFLTGELKATPYHHGPTDEETNPLLSDLIRLHARGLFTICGQPGEIEQPELLKYGWDGSNEEWFHNKYADGRKKAFIEFYAPHNNEHNSLIQHLIDNSSGPDGYRFIIMKNGDSWTNILGNKYYNITQERIAGTEEELSTTRWHNYSRVTPRRTKEYISTLFRSYPNIETILKDCWYVFMCHKKWGHYELESRLLQLCDEYSAPTYCMTEPE